MTVVGDNPGLASDFPVITLMRDKRIVYRKVTSSTRPFFFWRSYENL